MPPTAVKAARGITMPEEIIVGTDSIPDRAAAWGRSARAVVRALGYLRSTGTGPMHPSSPPAATKASAIAVSLAVMPAGGRESWSSRIT